MPLVGLPQCGRGLATMRLYVRSQEMGVLVPLLFNRCLSILNRHLRFSRGLSILSILLWLPLDVGHAWASCCTLLERITARSSIATSGAMAT